MENEGEEPSKWRDGVSQIGVIVDQINFVRSI
jgi:hypothetical protein